MALLKSLLFSLITIIVISSLCSCENDNEPLKKSVAKYHDFSLANSSDHDVSGFFQFGESKGTVGVVGAGASATLGFMPFSHAQNAIVSFKCEFEDELPCAIGEVDVSEHYPVGKFESVTTVFTYQSDNTVELSFSIREIGSDRGVTKDIVIGNISKK